MSGEQGDVEATKRALEDPRTKAELLAALERAERERDDALGERVIAQLDIAQARAEKAERALAEAREALRRIAEGDPPEDAELWWTGKSWRIELARAALRSEDTSDES